MTYDIKRTNGSVEWLVKTVHPTGAQGAKAMSENVVDMSFTLPIYVDFKINDFVVVYGETYKINLTPSVKKVAKRKYEYQIQFEHIFYDLAKVQLQGLNATNGYLEPVFNIMGNAATIIGLIVENANRHSPGWTVGVVDDTAYQNYSFNAENCLQVLNRLASDNETEFWIENKTIHLQKREQSSGLQFEYGQGKGLYSIFRSNKSNINILTRLYVRGGSRNLPLDYRDYATSLLLPGGLTYIQDDAKVNPQTGYGLIEATIVFDNIFPEYEGTISAVVAGDGNWDKFSDASLDFDVNAHKLATPAKVAFNTGQLAGYEFEISNYNHATKQFTIVQNTDETLTVPTNLIRPAVGDKYVLLDIRMPQARIDAAEAKLLSAAQAYYNKNSDPALNFSYAIDCDPIWFAKQNVNILLGNTVIIYDVDLGINGAIRIAGFKRDLQIPSKYELEISDSIGANEIVRQYAQQQRTLQLIESYGLLDINQVRKNVFLNRLSESGGYLMLSGTKINAGLADLALNANHANLADYALDADKWDGRQFADYLDQPLRKTDAVKFASVVADTVNSTVYVSGFTGSGYRINPDGSAEFDSLTVRKDLNINVLNVREITGSGGSVAITNVAKIKEVVDAGYYYQCKINTDEGTIAVQLRVGDIIRCQIWDGKKLKYYTARIINVTPEYFEFLKADMQGGGIPEPGDTVFQFGNTYNTDRQGLIYLTNSDTGAPYLDVLDGINSENLTGKTKVRLGKLDGINDADLGALSGYGIYGQNAFIKGKIHVTGGNAATITNVADAKIEAITTATSQASADATVKASSAQVAAIQAAANDASNKVNALKLGGRNLVPNSKQTLTFGNTYVQFGLSEPLIIGSTYTITLCGVRASGAALGVFGSEGSEPFVQFGSAEGLQVISNTIVYAGLYGHHSYVRVYSEHTTNESTIYWLKIEKGNKATDWTPAPEDADTYADQKALAAQTAAQNYATAQSAYEREVAKAYADGIVDAEELRAINDAAAKLAEAKADATAKVSAAQTAAAGYTDAKSQEALTAAQTYADNSAQSKANVAQANAISQASTDAQTKADAAQAAAATLSQQLITSLKIGGKNLILNSKQTTLVAYMLPFYLSEPLIIGETYTATLCGIRGNGAAFGVYGTQGYQQFVTFGTLDGLNIVSGTFVYGGSHGSHSEIRVYSENGNSQSTFYWAKIEKGNKPTDWTPAPEDVQAAIDLAKSTADAANASYTALTANLKSLAYADVVELAKLGSTIIENGMIKTTLLDANYIRANVVNAGYINTLNLDASAIKSGVIDSARINAGQIISNGGGATTAFVNSSITAATSQAEADATAKASAAQVAAIQIAANDVISKIAALKIGSRNLLLNSKQTFTTTNYQQFNTSEPLVAGETYTATMCGIRGDGASFALWLSQGLQNVLSFGGTSGLQIISSTFVYQAINGYHNDVRVYSENSVNASTFYWAKIEKGNKATDWTPAPEDLEAYALGKANDAQTAAQNYAAAQAAYEREIAKAYADGKVTAEEAARIAQAAANLQIAKDDATTKVNVALGTANGYTDSKSIATLSAAQTYADNSAQTKANAAQANAISQASSDAQAKANAAQAAAATLSQQLIDGLKIGGKNLLKNSKQTISGTGMFLQIPISEPLEPGQTYTATMNGIRGAGASFALWGSAGYERLVGFESANGLQTISRTFVYGGAAGNHSTIYVYSENSLNPSTFYWAKIEKGNKPTDWTPAPEDVQAAIDLAKSTADAANASYIALTANLKSLAYADVVELAKLGSTVIENGMIKTTLLDANYIRANIVNASYITALDIVATKVAATQGFIGGFNIVNQSLIAGSNSDNPSAWDLNSSNIRLYTDFQLYRKIGGTASQTDEMAVNLGYYPSSSGLPYKETLVLKNNIRNTAYPYGGSENPFITRAKNKALVLEARNSDEDIALEVMNGQIYLRGLWGTNHVSNAFQGYVKIVSSGGNNYLVLNDTKPPINSNIPDAQGLFWNDAQTAYATHGGCTGYDPQYGSEIGSEHSYTVPANTYSSSVSKALANSQAVTEAQNQAQYEADNHGYCYYQ